MVSKREFWALMLVVILLIATVFVLAGQVRDLQAMVYDVYYMVATPEIVPQPQNGIF
jgi:hypothetical protein